MGDEVKSLIIAIFRSDKTEGYGYSGKERDQNRFGFLPKGVGKRWATPRELAQQYARKHGFGHELFEKPKGDTDARPESD